MRCNPAASNNESNSAIDRSLPVHPMNMAISARPAYGFALSTIMSMTAMRPPGTSASRHFCRIVMHSSSDQSCRMNFSNSKSPSGTDSKKLPPTVLVRSSRPLCVIEALASSMMLGRSNTIPRSAGLSR